MRKLMLLSLALSAFVLHTAQAMEVPAGTEGVAKSSAREQLWRLARENPTSFRTLCWLAQFLQIGKIANMGYDPDLYNYLQLDAVSQQWVKNVLVAQGFVEAANDGKNEKKLRRWRIAPEYLAVIKDVTKEVHFACANRLDSVLPVPKNAAVTPQEAHDCLLLLAHERPSNFRELYYLACDIVKNPDRLKKDRDPRYDRRYDYFIGGPARYELIASGIIYESAFSWSDGGLFMEHRVQYIVPAYMAVIFDVEKELEAERKYQIS